MTKKDTISVIIPVYNTEQYIKECIESIINQTYKNLEIILVDDGSTDGTGKICDQYVQQDTRIIVIHQKNNGVVSAINAGIICATGEYMAFIDSDDWIEENMYESMMCHIGDCDILSTGMILEHYDSSDSQKMISKIPEGIYANDEEMFFICEKMIGHQSENNLGVLCSRCVHLFRSSIVKEIYLDVEPTITYGEDRVFVFDYILKCNSIRIMHEAFYHYRMRSSSCTHSVDKNFLANISSYYVALEKICREHPMKDVLLSQLETEIVELINYGIDYRLGFQYYRNIKYQIPFEIEMFKGKKVVLYAAGRVGKDYYYQLEKSGLPKEIKWIDREWERYKNERVEVESIESVLDRECDYILIAIKREMLAMDIKKELVERKINADKIIWKEPVQVR